MRHQDKPFGHPYGALAKLNSRRRDSENRLAVQRKLTSGHFRDLEFDRKFRTEVLLRCIEST